VKLRANYYTPFTCLLTQCHFKFRQSIRLHLKILVQKSQCARRIIITKSLSLRRAQAAGNVPFYDVGGVGLTVFCNKL